MHPNSSKENTIDPLHKRKSSNWISRTLIARLFAHTFLAIFFYADIALNFIHFLFPFLPPYGVFILDVIFIVIFLANAFSDILVFVYQYFKPNEVEIYPKSQKLFGINENEPGFIKSSLSAVSGSARFSHSFILPSCLSSNQSLLSNSPGSQLEMTSGSTNVSSNYSLNSSSWIYQSNPSASYEFLNKSLEKTPLSRRLSLKGKKTSTPIYSLESSPVGKSVLNQSDSILESSAFRNSSYSPQQNLSLISGAQESCSSYWNITKTFVDYMSILQRSQYQPATRSPQASINSDGPESPSHQSYNAILCRLNIKDEQLTNWIGNLRMWISQTVLRRLTKEIDEINESLYRTGCPDIQIGEVSLLSLKQIAVSKSQMLPTLSALLPYLEITANQEYLVERLKQLASGGSMSEYRWNGGGKFRGKPWGDELPTDAAIIFHLFCCYMDSRLPDCYPLGKTFTHQYVKKAPEKPQLNLDMFYIYQAQTNPPHYQVVLGKTLFDVPKGRTNLFCAILVFIDHIREKHAGMLSRVNLGPSGINILCVLQDRM